MVRRKCVRIFRVNTIGHIMSRREQDLNNTFANSIDPDETAMVSYLISIFTACHSGIDLQLSPFWQQWICTNAEMGESISET